MSNIFKLRRNILPLVISFALIAPSVLYAQSSDQATSETTPEKKKSTELEKVVVTGSNIARTEVEGAAPLMVITGEQLKKEGFNTIYEVMNYLPQAFRAQTPPSWGSTTVNARALNLRNLGPGFSLMLIDGRRVTDYPQPYNAQSNFQNYNNIPTGMIDRIEILGTGASSIYGSDAVAGVINFVLKHNYEGDELTVRTGRSERGGRNLLDFNFIGGKSGDNWNIVYNFQHTNRSALWGKDRPYTDSDSDAGYGTWNQTARQYGYQSISGIGLQTANGNYITPPAGACTQPGFHGDYRLQNSPNGYYCAQNAYFQNWVLTPGRIDNDLYVYGTYRFDSGIEAYGSVGAWRTTGISNTELPFLYGQGGPSEFFDKTTGDVLSNAGAVGGIMRQLGSYEIGTSANTYDRELNWDVHAGLKGTLWDDKLNWDASIGRSLYWVHESYTGLNEQGMFNFFFGPQQSTTTIGGTDYPVYQLNANRYWNPISPADYSTFGVNGENRAISWMNQGQFLVSGDLFDLPAGPLGFAGVLEANHQGYQLYPDPRGNTVTFGDPFQDYDIGGGERTRYSFAMEWRIPIVSTFTASVSGRIDKYDDISIADIARTWGLGLEWRPIQGLLLRGTYNTNFRAPDMQYIYKQGSVQTHGLYEDNYQCILAGQNPCPQIQVSPYFPEYAAGNPNLLPETGKSWSYGFVWDLPFAEGFSVSADYWRTGVRNAIQNIDFNTLMTDEAGCLTGKVVGGAPYIAHAQGSQYCQLVISDVKRDANNNIISVNTGPINLAQFYATGVDASLSYRWKTDHWGDFQLTANYTSNLSYYSRTLPTDPLLNTSYQSPRDRENASLNWNRDDWNATLFWDRIGPVRGDNYGGCEVLSDGTTPNLGDADCTVYKGRTKPWIIYNFSIGHQLNDHTKLSFYVNDIFNRVGRIPYYAGGFEFIDTLNGADYVGRELFIQVDYKF